jgi:hypothetical protein
MIFEPVLTKFFVFWLYKLFSFAQNKKDVKKIFGCGADPFICLRL